MNDTLRTPLQHPSPDENPMGKGLNDRRLRAAIEISSDSYVALQAVLDANQQAIDFIYTDVNAAAERQSGVSRAQLIGKRITEVRPTSSTRNNFDTIVAVYNSGQSRSEDVYYKDIAQPGWYRRQILRVEDGIVIFISSIHDRIELEKAIHASEERYRIIVESISDYVFSCHIEPDGTIVRDWTSGSYEEITGYTPEEKDRAGLLSLFIPEEHERVEKHLAEVLSGKVNTYDYRIRTKQGKLRWLRLRREPVWDETHSRVTRYYGIAQDITADKEIEIALLEQEKLRIALEKERELNTMRTNLMRTISHEFRTPLTMIGLSLDILERYSNSQIPREKQIERMNMIRAQLAQINQMVEDISLVLRGVGYFLRFNPESIDLVALSSHLIEELQLTVGARHRLYLDVKSEIGHVILDRALTNRIITNLVSNAIKYSPPDSTIRLEIDRQDHDIVIRVSDNGIGIPQPDIEHVFQPFHRGSNVGDIVGTGLGLNIVKDCVELHGGVVTVESNQGVGTTFIVKFPQRDPVGA